MNNVVAVIPAKGESTRLPGKNLLSFAGKPLVSHTIEQALGSNEVDKVYVSTDCQKIAKIARDLGADVPFLRPPSLSKPDVHALIPIFHLLEKTNSFEDFEFVMMMLPTCPLRQVKQINEVAQLAKKNRCNVLSVVDTGKTIFHLKTIDESGHAINLIDNVSHNFQHGDSSHVYSLNAACYCGLMSDLVEHRSFHAGSPLAFPMDMKSGMDIDTLEQFRIAEMLFSMDKQSV